MSFVCFNLCWKCNLLALLGERLVIKKYFVQKTVKGREMERWT